MIDIHTHLLPGVDDGSPSVKVSVPVLERFGREGVEVVVCTPHLNASEVRRAPVARYRSILDELRLNAPACPRVVLGWEIMLDVPGADLRNPDVHLDGSTAALVEFHRMNVPPAAVYELDRIRVSGVVPVLAHPERYFGCTVDQVAQWRSVGVVIQTDAIMLFGNSPPSKFARVLLQHGLVDCLASDNHGDHRNLRAARDWLVQIGAREQAQLLTRTNAERLLMNEPPLPVAPIPVADAGLLGKLRERLFGRR
ncbi:MAG TPA: CpsB/CapC family capsule biosynthesis tyrosine phosphatase [Gemmatimonadaceae bacterium]|nr:CpsB/CapC family capsule biosynthesis tyrosine phosphatase [Gemmatimonadaceae bacterium]